MPLEVDGLALVYNQDLFNKAGITTPPATWDDLRQDAAKITQRDASGKLLVGGIAMGSATNVDHYADIVGLLMAQNGVIFKDSKGKVSFQNSITPDGRNLGAEALSFYTLFTTTEKDWDSTMEQSTTAFAEGKVGMILIPSWRLLSLVSQNPDLPLKVAPVPHLTTDQKTGYASYWVEVVPKHGQHQLAAWQFLSWLSEKEQQLTMVEAQTQSRPFGEPYSRIDLGSSLSSDRYLAAYVAQAADLRASIFAGNTGANEFNDEINAALATAISQAQKSGSNRDSAAVNALDTLAETVTAILDKQ
jgi:multiple sugar transport system substrate-binding protein